jgi:hypothetical protein
MKEVGCSLLPIHGATRQKNAEAETIDGKEGLLVLLGDDHDLLLPSNHLPPAPTIRKNPFSSSRHVFWSRVYNVSLKREHQRYFWIYITILRV